jgi:glutathione-specific gamma-glutamylcyclotransferase
MSVQELWIFGYGSLVWNPGFAAAEQMIATLSGFSRSFCMRSFHYRGTPDAPGLVLALLQVNQAACNGLAFRASPGTETEVLSYLRARELISDAYLEENHPIVLQDGRQVIATCYVINTDHIQYSGNLSRQEQAEIISFATGANGPNTEYLFNTVSHLATLGISDPELEDLANRVRVLTQDT